MVVPDGEDTTIVVPDKPSDAPELAGEDDPGDDEEAPEVVCKELVSEVPSGEFGDEPPVDGRAPGVSTREIFDIVAHVVVWLVVSKFLLYILIVMDASESKTNVPLRSKVLEPGAKR